MKRIAPAGPSRSERAFHPCILISYRDIEDDLLILYLLRSPTECGPAGSPAPEGGPGTLRPASVFGHRSLRTISLLTVLQRRDAAHRAERIRKLRVRGRDGGLPH